MCAVALLLTLGLFNSGVSANNLSNPALCVPPGRLVVGASYHIGGYTITNQKVPAIFNRIMARLSFSPSRYVDFGIDGGVSQIDVGSYTSTSDTIPVFHGSFGFSGGGHIKGSTPFILEDRLGAIGIVGVSVFSSENTHGAYYGGFDVSGALGLQVKIPDFGAVAAGAQVYLIQGKNRGYLESSSSTHDYSNINNVRGWLAFDFLPSFKGEIKGKPYFSFEVTVAPDVDLGGSPVPLEEIGFSFSLGWISPRLYGEDLEDIE